MKRSATIFHYISKNFTVNWRISKTAGEEFQATLPSTFAVSIFFFFFFFFWQVPLYLYLSWLEISHLFPGAIEKYGRQEAKRNKID